MDPSTTVQHALWLKVVRLMKPGLMTAPVDTGEEWHALGRVLETEHNKDIRTTPTLPGLPISDKLEIVQTEESSSKAGHQIYLGESYRVYVSLGNEIKSAVTDIVLKVEVITASHNRILIHQSPPLASMGSGERLDNVLSYDVKDMGEHSIICTVSYTLYNGEERLLRDIQRFNVNKPLEVRPDFQVLENDILFTIQIQNVMLSPVFLETVQFEPATEFTSQDLTITNQGYSVFGTDLFHPHSSRQYLYRITPLYLSYRGAGPKVVSVGKMDIIWRGRFGEKGRIQTGQLKVTLPPIPDLQVSLVKSPSRAMIEQTFPIGVTITNNTDHRMILQYQLEKQVGSGVLWCGTTKDTLQELSSKESLQLSFTLLPTTPGLQAIGHMTFTDVLNDQKKYPITKLGHVFVSRDTDSMPQPLSLTINNNKITLET